MASLDFDSFRWAEVEADGTLVVCDTWEDSRVLLYPKYTRALYEMLKAHFESVPALSGHGHETK